MGRLNIELDMTKLALHKDFSLLLLWLIGSDGICAD